MTKSKCKYCGGSFKTSSKEYVLRSRHFDKPETTIENLQMQECTICGHAEMPEDSARYIDMIRHKIRSEMQEQSQRAAAGTVRADEGEVLPRNRPFDKPLLQVKEFFRQLIG